MKKYSPIILFLFILISGCELSNFENDLNEINTFGKVKSIRERTFIANEETGNITIGRQVDPADGSHSHYKEFNKKGFIIELIKYDGEDFVKSSAQYKYDSDNRILKEKLYSSDGNLNSIISYVYDSKHLISKFNIRNNDTTSYIEFAYNDKDLLIEERHYSNSDLRYITDVRIIQSDSSITEERTTSFTDSEDIYYEKIITESNKLVYTELDMFLPDAWPERTNIINTYMYNDRGNISENKRITKRLTVEEFTITYDYEDYDNQDNWVSMYKYINGDLGNYIERKIEYY